MKAKKQRKPATVYTRNGSWTPGYTRAFLRLNRYGLAIGRSAFFASAGKKAVLQQGRKIIGHGTIADAIRWVALGVLP